MAQNQEISEFGQYLSVNTSSNAVSVNAVSITLGNCVINSTSINLTSLSVNSSFVSSNTTIALTILPFYAASPTVSIDYTVSNTYNQLTPGPVTVANGVTVTVANNATWTVV